MLTCRQFEVQTPAYQDALLLREEILRKPMGLALTQAELTLEPACFHLGAFDGPQLVAVLLLLPLDEHTVKMRQVAVRRERQRSGAGSQLIAFAEAFARQGGYRSVVAHARSTALEFYLRLGYSASGAEFIETTIPHQLVRKALERQ